MPASGREPISTAQACGGSGESSAGTRRSRSPHAPCATATSRVSRSRSGWTLPGSARRREPRRSGRSNGRASSTTRGSQRHAPGRSRGAATETLRSGPISRGGGSAATSRRRRWARSTRNGTAPPGSSRKGARAPEPRPSSCVGGSPTRQSRRPWSSPLRPSLDSRYDAWRFTRQFACIAAFSGSTSTNLNKPMTLPTPRGQRLARGCS